MIHLEMVHLFNVHFVRSAVLGFLIATNLWILSSWQAFFCIDHPTSLGYESTLHGLRTDDAYYADRG